MEEYRDQRRTDERGLYYRNSGRCDFIRLPLVWIGLALAMVVGAVVYSAVQRYMPSAYGRIFVTLGFGVGIGALASVMLLWAHNRNNVIKFLTGLVAALTALWLAWGFWAIFWYQDAKLFSMDSVWVMHPQVLLNCINEALNTEHYLTVGSTDHSGWSMLILWVAEAVGIIGGCMWMLFRMFRSRSFCEHCGIWTKNTFVSYHLSNKFDHGEMRSQLEQHDFNGLKNLPMFTVSPEYTQVEIQKCACGGTYLLSLADFLVTSPPGAKEIRKRTGIVEKLYISEEEAQALAGHFKPA